MTQDHGHHESIHTWEPEFVVAKLETQLRSALEFTSCAEYAPEIASLARALSRRQRRMYRMTRRHLLRRPIGL